MAVDGALRCEGCGADYPLVDGIPVVARDPDALLASEDPGSAARAAVYARSREGPLQDWLREVVTAGALELAGGLGVRDDTVVVDMSLAMLRAGRAGLGSGRAGRGARICADLLDPPFLPASFEMVVLANVLDVIEAPLLAFQQAVALLAQGGRLVVTCPYAFTNGGHNGCRLEPFPPAALHAGFGAVEAGILALVTARERDWPLRTTDRLTQVHRTDAVIFERRGPSYAPAHTTAIES